MGKLTANSTSSPAYVLLTYTTGRSSGWPTNGRCDADQIFSYAMFAFWSVVIAVASALNAAAVLRLSRSSHDPALLSSRPELTEGFVAKSSSFYRAILLDPATFSYRCQTPYGQCTIPPRAETLLLLAYFVFTTVLCSISYPVYDRDLIFHGKIFQQALRYVSDRNGYLAYVNLGISWLFGMRNNLLIWSTGWSFATFNRFHRWVARIAAVQAIIHSIGYSVYAIVARGWGHYTSNFLLEYWSVSYRLDAGSCTKIKQVYWCHRSHLYESAPPSFHSLATRALLRLVSCSAHRPGRSLLGHAILSHRDLPGCF